MVDTLLKLKFMMGHTTWLKTGTTLAWLMQSTMVKENAGPLRWEILNIVCIMVLNCGCNLKLFYVCTEHKKRIYNCSNLLIIGISSNIFTFQFPSFTKIVNCMLMRLWAPSQCNYDCGPRNLKPYIIYIQQQLLKHSYEKFIASNIIILCML